MNYEYLCDKSAISLVNTDLFRPLSSVVVRRQTTSYVKMSF